MNDYAKYQLRLAKERRNDEFREAAEARQPSLSFRQAVGHRFIRIGARLAAEPPLESVRSR